MSDLGLLPIIQVVGGVTAVLGGERTVGVVMLFRQHLDFAEEGRETGSLQLVMLLLPISLGDEQNAVPGRKIGERVGHAGQQFDLLLGNGVREAVDACAFFFREWRIAELFKAKSKRLTEALQPVAMCRNGGAFDRIQVAAHLGGAVHAVVKIRDEGGNRPLEVDVVLPQRIVSVDEQCLTGSATSERLQ